MIAYVDASCAVALLKREDKSEEISAYLAEWIEEGHLVVAGTLLETELHRVAARFGIADGPVQAVLDEVNLIPHTSVDFRRAGQLPGPYLGSLDALHLATALRVPVDVMLSEDARLVEASEAMGLPVLDTSIPARSL